MLDKVGNRFKLWLNFYNTTDVFISYSKNVILWDPRKPTVNFENAWLSVFTQAEGGF